MKNNNKILIIVLCLCVFCGFAGYFLKDLFVNRTPAAQVAENVPNEESDNIDYQFDVPDQEEHDSNAISSEVYSEPLRLYKCAQITYITEETVYNRETDEYVSDNYTRYYDAMINLDEMTEISFDCTEGANNEFNKELVKDATFDELFGFSYNEAKNAAELIDLLYANIGFDMDTEDAYAEDELSINNRHDTYICNGSCTAVQNLAKGEGTEPLYEQCGFKMYWLPDGTPYPSSLTYCVCFQISDQEFKTCWGSIEVKINNDDGTNRLNHAFLTEEDLINESDGSECDCSEDLTCECEDSDCSGDCSTDECSECEDGCDGCESCLEDGCCAESGEPCSCEETDETPDLIETDLILLTPDDVDTYEEYKEAVLALPKNEWIREDHYWYYLVENEEEFYDIYYYKIFRAYPEIMKEFISTYDDIPDIFSVYCDRVDLTGTVWGIKICMNSEIERDRCPCGYYALPDDWN